MKKLIPFLLIPVLSANVYANTLRETIEEGFITLFSIFGAIGNVVSNREIMEGVAILAFFLALFFSIRHLLMEVKVFEGKAAPSTFISLFFSIISTVGMYLVLDNAVSGDEPFSTGLGLWGLAIVTALVLGAGLVGFVRWLSDENTMKESGGILKAGIGLGGVTLGVLAILYIIETLFRSVSDTQGIGNMINQFSTNGLFADLVEFLIFISLVFVLWGLGRSLFRSLSGSTSSDSPSSTSSSSNTKRKENAQKTIRRKRLNSIEKTNKEVNNLAKEITDTIQASKTIGYVLSESTQPTKQTFNDLVYFEDKITRLTHSLKRQVDDISGFLNKQAKLHDINSGEKTAFWRNPVDFERFRANGNQLASAVDKFKKHSEELSKKFKMSATQDDDKNPTYNVKDEVMTQLQLWDDVRKELGHDMDFLGQIMPKIMVTADIEAALGQVETLAPQIKVESVRTSFYNYVQKALRKGDENIDDLSHMAFKLPVYALILRDLYDDLHKQLVDTGIMTDDEFTKKNGTHPLFDAFNEFIRNYTYERLDYSEQTEEEIRNQFNAVLIGGMP